MDHLSDAKIVDSWGKNASAWATAVRDGQIESRTLVTNRAIVDAVLSRSPRTVLDIGCGEGWLARELAAKAINVVGIDVVHGLIERAQETGGGNFHLLSYEELVAGKFKISADAVVCNFSLFGDQSVEELFRVMPSILNERGSLIVQTLHSVVACGNQPYQVGWRNGSWDGFSSDFIDPAPWYFRTLENWVTLFATNGFKLLEVREPIHPTTQLPASVIFIAELGH